MYKSFSVSDLSQPTDIGKLLNSVNLLLFPTYLVIKCSCSSFCIKNTFSLKFKTQPSAKSDRK